MKVIIVKIKENSYKIHLGEGIIRNLSKYITELKLGNTAIVVTCKTVHRLYSKQIVKYFGKIDTKFVVLPNGEGAKTQENLFKIEKEALRSDGWGKKIFFIALGGGTIGDVTGFAASIYKRGTPYINIPTTLLAQVDSSIGGKTAINLKEAKNILGTFYQPRAVIIDTGFLKTLSMREIAQGIAEVIKYGLICDKNLFYFLENNHKKIMTRQNGTMLKIITACARIKADIVGRDMLEEKGLRTILNFGHTLGHAIEASLQYRGFSHGEAIAIGMIYAVNLSIILGKCGPCELNRTISIIRKFSLPVTISTVMANLQDIMKYDKKFIAGKTRMVLLNKIGKVEVCTNISEEKLRQAFDIFSPASVSYITTCK